MRRSDRSLFPGFLPLTMALATTWALVFSAPAASAQVTWEIIKHESRDYLSMRNVANFYKLQYTQPSGKEILLQSPGCSIRGSIGSKELIINGVKFIMACDLVSSGDQILLSRLDLTKLVEPVLRPNRIKNMNAIRTVIIDAGHGGHDRGATSVYGDEKNFALDVSLRLRELLLRRGLKVQMTRSTDTFIPLEQRAAFASQFRDGIFVCIHFNAGSDSGTGIETYTMAPRFVPSTGDDSPSASLMHAFSGNGQDPENMALATAMHASLLSRLPMVDRGIKRARFCVLRLATIPAVLIEGGFVSNLQEAARIATPAYRQAEAEAIANAIKNYQLATGMGLPSMPILAGGQRSMPLGINPGVLQITGGVPVIGASVPIDAAAAARVSNMKPPDDDGPTVVVPNAN
jgi:N-acetylmuramoyl-L-alanine amidase